MTVTDLSVGFAFVIAGWAATGPALQRALVGAVGPAWLAGSLFSSALSLHQALLAVALLTFPSGRLRNVPSVLISVCAVLVGCEFVPQLGVAGLFAGVAAVAFLTAWNEHAATYPVSAAAAIVAVLWFSWWSVRHAADTSPIFIYEATLIGVAAGFPLATRVSSWSRATAADRVLADVPVAGLPGLQLVLAAVLNDPGLRIDLGDDETRRLASKAGARIVSSQPATELRVLDGDQLLARILTTSRAVSDRLTARAIEMAVRLMVINHRLRQQQAQRLAELEASRSRLLAAADRERERIASRLRNEAGVHLEQARVEFAAGRPAADPELAELIDFAGSEVAAVADEVERIVDGVPPVALGAGQLRVAILLLAARIPVPVALDISGDTAADVAVETALFYVCSETLTNVAKHSTATNVEIDLHRQGPQIVLTVSDDGQGGADSAGSGLLGLADRLATVGGRITITSPSGAGTTIRATVPWR